MASTSTVAQDAVTGDTAYRGRHLHVAVVGATGQVGGVLRTLLSERGFPVASVRYLASSRSAGTDRTSFSGQRSAVRAPPNTHAVSRHIVSLIHSGSGVGTWP